MRTPPDPRDKDAWRRQAKRARAALDRTAWASDLVAALRGWAPYRRAATVASYLAFGSEANLASLARDGVRLALPRIQPDGRTLRFYEAGGPVARHPFGMDEPRADAAVVPTAEIELVLVPGLAFDWSGRRLGYGRGFYDRWLATLGPEVPRVGVAHPALVVARLPAEHHDARMTHLVLPEGVVSCRDG